MSIPMSEPLHEPEAAAQGSAGPPVLDPQALARLTELDPTGASQLFVRVMGTYRKSLARLAGQMASARTPFDADALRLATHTLKSSSGSVGASHLAQLCGSAETALREGRFDEVPRILDALLAEAARVDEAVKHLLLPA